ncbi:UNVERIFIED_CONTAM: hypothetical protein FKN15_017198, partial [Acipenser sinensis]
WVASSFRPVAAVWKNDAVLNAHFTLVSEDVFCNLKIHETFCELAKSLSSKEFVLNLELMMDTLAEITKVSEHLQKEDITLARACQVISRTIQAIEKMKEDAPAHIHETQQAVAGHLFKSIHLVKSTTVYKQAATTQQQFLQSLVNNLRSHLFTTVASNRAALPGDINKKNIWLNLLIN